MNNRVSFGLAKTSALVNPAHRTQARTLNTHLSMQDTRLLERFTAEVTASALSCAALLSCFNTIQFDRVILMPADLRLYTPPSPMTFTAVTGSEIAELLSHETRAALSGYQYYLEAGKRLLSGHLEPGRENVAVEFDAFRALLAPFKTASLFSLMTARDLSQLHASMGTGKCIGELDKLAADLDEANRGGTPYFLDRHFVVPGAADQMRGLRIQLNSEAVLTHRGGVSTVIVRDVSQGGLGLEGVEAMRPGSAVSLLLPTGRKLSGEVHWQEGTRAGINLTERLALSDPLMCA